MNRELKKKAWKKVKRIKRFYYHMGAFAIMGTFFFFMNMVTDPFDMWFYFPMIPWSAALAFHYLAVFGIPGTNLLTKEWEEREFERQMDKLEDQYGYDPMDDTFQKGKYLEYTELSAEETLELRKLQQASKTSKGDEYFGEDFV